MSPNLQAGDLASLTWTHVWVALLLLFVYVGAGVCWAFRIRRARDARLGLSSARSGARPRSLAQFLEDVYAMSALRAVAARVLGALCSRAHASLAARRSLAKEGRAPAA